MDHLNSADWNAFLENSLSKLVSSDIFSFNEITPSMLPEKAGIYLISENMGNQEVCLYIGRTKNIRQRIYTNHLMGSFTNARLKKYLTQDALHFCFGSIDQAKLHIKNNCHVRWIFEEDTRKRGALEGYFTGKFFPKYGIAEEH